MEEGPTLSFRNISTGSKVKGSVGALKLTKGGFGWKGREGKTVSVQSKDIKDAFWTRTGNHGSLKLVTSSGNGVRFNGFAAKDFETLADFTKSHFGVDVEQADLCTKGWNWGTFGFGDNENVTFTIDNKSAFEVPFSDISQAHITKNELRIELNQDDIAGDDEAECLVEMRITIPGQDGQEVTDMHEELVERAELRESEGGGICALPKLKCLVPRGRYDFELYLKAIKFSNASFTFKVPYTSIARVTSLESATRNQLLQNVVLSLDPPIRHGATMYPHIVMAFPLEEESHVDLNMDEKQLQKYKLQETEQGLMHEVFVRLVQKLSKCKKSKLGDFRSHYDSNGISCSHKTNDGYLYPMRDAFFFLNKPPTYILYEDISLLEFARIGAGATGTTSRTFDLVVTTNDGTPYVFVISRDEYPNLEEFLNTKQINIKQSRAKDDKMSAYAAAIAMDNEMDSSDAEIGGDGELDSEEEDDDFMPGKEELIEEDFVSDEEQLAEIKSDGEEDDDDDGETPSKKKKEKKQEEKSSRKRKRSEKKEKKEKSSKKPNIKVKGVKEEAESGESDDEGDVDYGYSE